MVGTSGSGSEWLLQRAVDGDREAQAELFSRYRDRLRQLVAIRLDRRIVSRVDASDIVQDALNVAYRRLPTYGDTPPRLFYPWLRRIALQRLADVYRFHVVAGCRSVLNEHPWTPNLNEESVTNLAHCIAESTISPSRRFAQGEMQARIRDALIALGPDDREILVLRFLEQLSVDEIAEVLDIAPSTVTSRQLRALQRLRKHLGDDFEARYR